MCCILFLFTNSATTFVTSANTLLLQRTAARYPIRSNSTFLQAAVEGSGGGTQLDSTFHQAAVEASDGRAQVDSTLHQAAVLLFEQGDVNLPARVSPEASLNKIVCRMREKTQAQV